MGGVRRVGWLLLLAGCAAPARPVRVDDRATASLEALLVADCAASRQALPRTAQDIGRWPKRAVVVLLARQASLPSVPLDESGRQALGEWLRQGGALLTLGYASRVVHELGIEPVAPDRFDRFRWGVSDDTAIGNYRFGFRYAETAPSPPVRELRAEPGTTDVFLVGGGDLVDVQSCHWETRAPLAGEVLGTLARTRDGELASLSAAVLVHWRDGNGQILAYGSVPEPWRAEETIAANARRFVADAVRWLGGDGGLPVILCADRRPATAPIAALPPLAERLLPGGSPVALWGWQLTIAGRDGGLPMTPGRALDQVLLPSWRAGADQLALVLADGERGYPWSWPVDDPIAPPAGYRSHGQANDWAPAALAGLAVEAHRRGTLLQAYLRPPLAGSGPPPEQLAALKWFGRELLDPRLHGDGALDAVGLDDWIADADGFTVDIVRAAHPAARVFLTSPAARAGAGAIATLHARFGRLPGLDVAGLSARWRAAYDDCDAAVLDCVSGGSYGDWLLTQFDDFVRDRRGAAVSWDVRDPASLPSETVRYVHGLSAEPLSAAVAARLWATGVDGYRDQLRRSSERLQEGFGAESPLPSHVPFLQNNHFRLHGSGGPLWVDPTGRASFDLQRGGCQEVAVRFMRTRLRGARPDVDALERRIYDAIAGAPRPAGESGERVAVAAPFGAGVFPAMLAFEDRAHWPRRVDVTLQPEPGSYDLELALRAVNGSGTVELRRDGELLQVLLIGDGEGTRRHQLRCDVVRGGERTLSLEVVAGGAIAVDVFRLVQRASVDGVTDLLAAESALGDLAGARAELQEWNGASFFNDRVRWTTIADLPGFSMAGDYLSVARNLEVVRSFELQGYDVVRADPADRPEQLRRPFVLLSSRRGLPDLAVVPVELPRYHWFSFSRAAGLQLVARPRPNERFRVGFLFLRDHGREALPHLAAVFDDLQNPRTLDIAGTGGADLLADLPIAWPRVVRIVGGSGPYRVRERGAWSQRGGQPIDVGGDWLRVYQFPGDVVKIIDAQTELDATRPGPGSLHSVVLRTPSPGAVTVDVHAVGPCLDAPSVVLAQAFDRVTVNGEPWSYASGQTVRLPRRLGTYAVVGLRGGRPTPRLERTAANVLHCTYDEGARTLMVETTAGIDGGPQFFTAWISGGTPTSFDGCERVDDAELSYRAEQGVRVRQAGFLVRFRPGRWRVVFD